MQECGIVFMTASSNEEADKIASTLVENKLVACVNIVSKIVSVYWWEGKICKDSEVLLIAKTTAALFDSVVQAVTSIHSYKVPEIIFTPISKGLPDYLNWVSDVTVK